MTIIADVAERLEVARAQAQAVAPFGESGLDLAGAFHVQRTLAGDAALAGWRIIGVGVAARALPGLGQAAFGRLTGDMFVDDTDTLDAGTLIAPRVAGSLAFLLKDDLAGDDVGVAQVLAATQLIFPAIDLSDRRVAGDRIDVIDAVADNGFGGHVVLGDGGVPPVQADLECAGVVVEVNGALAATGAGAAVLGHPARAVVWLVHALAARGEGLKAGQLVLAGELTMPVPVGAGDNVRVTVGGMGSAALRLV
jgi:2-oxopent-4-enoate/cis-2-oxohex-4-enoate hydratase